MSVSLILYGVSLAVSLTTMIVTRRKINRMKKDEKVRYAEFREPTAEADRHIPVVFGTKTITGINCLWVAPPMELDDGDYGTRGHFLICHEADAIVDIYERESSILNRREEWPQEITPYMEQFNINAPGLTTRLEPTLGGLIRSNGLTYCSIISVGMLKARGGAMVFNFGRKHLYTLRGRTAHWTYTDGTLVSEASTEGIAPADAWRDVCGNFDPRWRGQEEFDENKPYVSPVELEHVGYSYGTRFLGCVSVFFSRTGVIYPQSGTKERTIRRTLNDDGQPITSTNKPSGYGHLYDGTEPNIGSSGSYPEFGFKVRNTFDEYDKDEYLVYGLDTPIAWKEGFFDKRRIGNDLNPAFIIYMVLVHKVFGANIPGAKISKDSFISASGTLYTEELGLSFLLDAQITYEDFILDVCDHINGVVRENRQTGLIELKLLRKDYDIVDEVQKRNIVSVNNFEHIQEDKKINTLVVKYENSTTNEQDSVTIVDTVERLRVGESIIDEVFYKGITNRSTAERVGARDLSGLQSSQRIIDITFYESNLLCNVGDVFTFDLEYLNIQDIVFRISEITEGTKEEGTIRVVAVEDVFNDRSIIFGDLPDSAWIDPEKKTTE